MDNDYMKIIHSFFFARKSFAFMLYVFVCMSIIALTYGDGTWIIIIIIIKSQDHYHHHHHHWIAVVMRWVIVFCFLCCVVKFKIFFLLLLFSCYVIDVCMYVSFIIFHFLHHTWITAKNDINFVFVNEK